MKCFGLTINLRDDPEVIERYKAYHRAVWPEVLEDGRKKGILAVRIFMLGHRLFMYLETTDDYDMNQALVPQGQDDLRRKEWDELMRSLQEPVPEARPGEWWAEMELVHETANVRETS